MKLALVGTGQMGQVVETLASERGHEVVARFDSEQPLTEAKGAEALNGAEVAIDFSLPEVVLDHIERYCRWQQPAVVGTTGWYDALDTVRAWVKEFDAALLYAPNFSMGVALLRRALHGIVPLLEQLPDYDAFVHEVHHTRKADSPSGTAKMLGQEILKGLSRKTHLDTETQHGRIDPEALHVTSTRVGTVFGRHTAGFDSPFDQLRFTHEAKGRTGFAFGALQAAAWIRGRQGLFTLEDMLTDWLAVASDSEQ